MEEFQTKITTKWENPQQIAVTDMPEDGTYNNILSLEKEDDEFINEFNHLIQDHDLKEVEDLTLNDPELGTRDPYLDMELSLCPSKEEAAHYARVKSLMISIWLPTVLDTVKEIRPLVLFACKQNGYGWIAPLLKAVILLPLKPVQVVLIVMRLTTELVEK